MQGAHLRAFEVAEEGDLLGGQEEERPAAAARPPRSPPHPVDVLLGVVRGVELQKQ